MIILHQYPKAFGLSSLSPFCMKVEAYLKFSGLVYETRVELNPARGPKGKMPFIKMNGREIADSSLIIHELTKTHQLRHLIIEEDLQRATALAFKSMIEESLYFVLLYSRWMDEEGFGVIKKHFTKFFPPLLGGLALKIIRRNLKKQAIAQGLGRHTQDDVYQIGIEQLGALSCYLGKKDFFFEDKITEFDMTCYAFLATILYQPIDSPLKRALCEKKNLCTYVARLDAQFKLTSVT
jgi:glutathione S-transferase